MPKLSHARKSGLVLCLLMLLAGCDASVDTPLAPPIQADVVRTGSSSAAASALTAEAEEVWGPETFWRQRGRPVTEVRPLDLAAGPEYWIRLQTPADGRDRIRDGEIRVDGELIVQIGEEEPFETLEVPLGSGDLGELSVRLTGKPGTRVSVSVLAEPCVIGSAGGVAESEDARIRFDLAPGATTSEIDCDIERVDWTDGTPDQGLPGSRFRVTPAVGGLAVPATVTIQYGASDLPAGVEAYGLRLHRFDGTDWIPLADPTAEPGLVSGTTDATGTFALFAQDVVLCDPGSATVQSAIRWIPSGGQVLLCDGVWPARDVELRKPMTLKAAAGASPVLDADGGDAILYSVDDAGGDVVLVGLTFQSALANAIYITGPTSGIFIDSSRIEASSGTRGVVVTGAEGLVRVIDSEFTGGQWGVFAVNSGTLGVTGSSFADHDVGGVGFGPAVSGFADQNTFTRCGGGCVGVFAAGEVFVTSNVMTNDRDAAAQIGSGVFGNAERLVVKDNDITGAGTNDNGVYDSWAFGNGVSVAAADLVVEENRITGSWAGIRLDGGGDTGTGYVRNNVVDGVRTGFEAGPAFRTVSALQMLENDIVNTAASFFIESALPAGSLACNWWGSVDGPSSVDPGFESLYSPWATGPVANGAGGACDGGVGTAAPEWASISTFSNATCAVDRDDQGWCWGQSVDGAVGDGGGTTFRETPTAVVGGMDFRQIVASHGHSCGVTSSNQAYCWGQNGNGQLGTGDLVSTFEPTAVVGGHAFVEIDASAYLTCALTSVGDAYCWGWNPEGGLGDGSTVTSHTPVAVAGGLTFTSIDVGYQIACGMTADGPFCWGYSYDGRMGNGTAGAIGPVPTPVPAATTSPVELAEIFTEGSHSCGLDAAGAAYCWGSNRSGEVGDGSFTRHHYEPVAVAGGLEFTELSLGFAALTCGLERGGGVYCWGANQAGEIGQGTTSPYYRVPTLVPLPGPAVEVAAGNTYACAVLASGEAYCWGNNDVWQHGTGELGDNYSPVRVADPEG